LPDEGGGGEGAMVWERNWTWWFGKLLMVSKAEAEAASEVSGVAQEVGPGFEGCGLDKVDKDSEGGVAAGDSADVTANVDVDVEAEVDVDVGHKTSMWAFPAALR
jgi:hypothetical protein